MFFKKLKELFREDVDIVVIEPTTTFDLRQPVHCRLAITAKQALTIDRVEVRIDRRTEIDGEHRPAKELGGTSVSCRPLAEGETVEVTGSFPVDFGGDNDRNFAAEGGMLGGLGKLGMKLGKEKTTYELVVFVDVAGASADRVHHHPLEARFAN